MKINYNETIIIIILYNTINIDPYVYIGERIMLSTELIDII